MLVLKYNLAFRHDNRHHVETTFYGLKNNAMAKSHIGQQSLIRILKTIKPGVTELICHPGHTGNRLKDPYKTQRNIELTTLTSKSAKQAIYNERIHTITFKEYKKLSANQLSL